MRWMIKDLDQTQEIVLREVISHSGVSWVDGFAGSGKSIVAAHICNRLKRSTPSAKIALITYTHALKEMLQVGMDKLQPSEVIVTTHTDLLKSDKKNMHYDAIVLDEVQDIPLCDIKKIKLMCTRLVLAGDVDQSIYPNGITAEDLRSNLQPKEQRLRKIFRLTEKARRIALSVLPNANVVAGENASNRAEADIKRVNFNDNGEEANWVYEDACNRARPDYPSGIFLTTHNEIRKFAELVAAGAGLPNPPRRARSFINGGKNEDRYADFNAFWERNGHPLRVLGSGSGDLSKSSNEPIVYLTTYHSAKGLDFQNVYLPRSVEGINLDPTGNGGEKLERRLMFVAITRTRENLFITHTGTRAHRYIEELPSADIIRISNPKRHNFTQEPRNDIF